MATSTVNISFQKDFLNKIDKVAEKECRTRSELIREAARKYITSIENWETIFKISERNVKKNNIKVSDIEKEIKKHRAIKNQ
jgi:metal-responsive CopG/Arc/MetJ family transcriptional regulator